MDKNNKDDYFDTIFEEYDSSYSNDSTSLYMKDVRKYRLLTDEEERMLFYKYKNGDIKSREMLINHNQRLVISIVRSFPIDNQYFLPLIQEGNIGLIKAIDTFDYDLGYKLSTYASYHIKSNIYKYFYNNQKIIKIPKYMFSLKNKLNKLITRYESFNIKITDEMLARDLNTSIDTIIYLKNLGNLQNTKLLSTISVDKADNFNLEDLIEERVLKEELIVILKEELTDLEYQVIMRKFGLYDGVCCNYRQISEILHTKLGIILSEEKKALRKLRKNPSATFEKIKFLKNTICGYRK